MKKHDEFSLNQQTKKTLGNSKIYFTVFLHDTGEFGLSSPDDQITPQGAKSILELCRKIHNGKEVVI